MRAFVLLLIVTLAACSTSDDADPDAGPQDAGPRNDAATDANADAGPDASLDAARDAAEDASDAATCPKVLLVGGTDVAAQGWTVIQQPPATLTYEASDTRLATTTTSGARTSGQLLLHYPGAFETGKPFKVQIVMRVESVNNHKTTLDSGAAILGSFTAPFGDQTQRGQMIYLDSAEIGWADDTQRIPVSVAGAAYHTYELSVDAANVARVSIDGAPTLQRSGFTFNGNLAIGDQTNDADIDSVTYIRSVTKLCPP